jgi:hypothetical protein
MGSVVGLWLGEVAKFGRPEAAQAAGAGAGRCHPAEEGIVRAETGKEDADVQEKTSRQCSEVLSDAEAVVCLLMDRFAPA